MFPLLLLDRFTVSAAGSSRLESVSSLTPCSLNFMDLNNLAFANVNIYKTFWKELMVCFPVQFSPANCSWPSPAQSLLASGPVGTHNHIFVLSRLLRVLKWGLLFDERRDMTTTGHSPSTGEWLFWLSLSLTRNSVQSRVRVTLRLAVYRQSVRLGAKSLEAHEQSFFFIEPLRP
jgi:hypothetical protein